MDDWFTRVNLTGRQAARGTTVLSTSEGMVKVYLHSIYHKLGCGGRLALLRYAQDKGLV